MPFLSVFQMIYCITKSGLRFNPNIRAATSMFGILGDYCANMESTRKTKSFFQHINKLEVKNL